MDSPQEQGPSNVLDPEAQAQSGESVEQTMPKDAATSGKPSSAATAASKIAQPGICRLARRQVRRLFHHAHPEQMHYEQDKL